MLNNTEWKILRVLNKHHGEFISSKTIATELNVSDRTVRTYIKNVIGIVQAHGAEIIAKQGSGYKLMILDRFDFNLFLRNVSEIRKNRKDATLLEGTSERQYYLLNRLLLEDQVLSIDQVAAEMYVSDSTIAGLIAEIRKLLKSYSLKVKIKGDQEFYIDGDERNKRHFIMDYFFNKKFGNSLSSNIDDHFLFNDINFAELIIILLDECREAKLKLSDYVIRNLALHIALAVKRIKDGFKIQSFPDSDRMSCSKEYEVAQKILYRIERSFKVSFPKEEANYIALHLKAKTNATAQESHGESDHASNVKRQLVDIFEKMDRDLSINIANDPILIEGMVAHFKPFLSRLKSGILLDNPLLPQFKEQYSAELNLTKKYFKSMPVLAGYDISNDEWAYIALHIMAALERYANKRKVKTLVVCATGYGSAQMLKTQLEIKFGNRLTVVDVISYYEITDEILKGIDLIISSIDLSHIVLPVPALVVDVFLTEQDQHRIGEFIEQSNRPNKRYGQNELPENKHNVQIFDEYFSPERFIIIDGKTTKQEVLKRMIVRLEEYGQKGFESLLLKQMELRETYSSIVFGKTLAFPHPAHPIGIKGQIVVAMCRSGIYWDEENPDVKLVFLMSPSRTKNEGLERVSRSLVTLVQNQNLQEQIITCQSFDQFRETFIPIMKK